MQKKSHVIINDKIQYRDYITLLSKLRTMADSEIQQYGALTPWFFLLAEEYLKDRLRRVIRLKQILIKNTCLLEVVKL